MLQTGRGLRAALAAAAQPVRPIARAKKALSGRKAAPATRMRPIDPEDAAVIQGWKPEAQLVGNRVVAHAATPAVDVPGVNLIETAALTDDAGNLRAVVSYEITDDALYVNDLASAGKGGGREAMEAVAAVASDRGLGVKLASQDAASHAFYTKLGMRQVGKRDFEWSPEEAAAFADDVPGAELTNEAGFLRPGAFLPEPHVRTLQYNDKVQQIPSARSRFTRRLIEQPADWTSAQLMREESKAAALVNKLLPTASAEKRVAKAAGRAQRAAAARAYARMMEHVHRLPKVGSDEDMAHFYWAQLPAEQRNAEGLQLVRDRQAEEIEHLTSGNALAQIESMMAETKAQLAETDDLALLGDLENLKILATDIPARIEDLSASLAKLDALIANPPKLDDKVISAMRALSEERKSILMEAGVLDPERALAREGLFSDWVGLEPTGEEVYVGHRLGKVKRANESLLPASPEVGRAVLPPGARQPNQLVLARTGRFRPSTHVAAEDWRAAQTYEAALLARDDLALMGTPFEGRLPEGYMMVNPKGRAIPAHWKRLPAFDELSDEEVEKAAREIRDGFLADANGADEMIRAAKEAGVNWDELRIVPKSVVDRYYGQFTPVRNVGKVGRTYDASVDFMAASLIFARIGYVPKNIFQNLIMAVPHQGPLLFINVPRAAQALLDPDLRHFLHAEVGFSGQAAGLGEELSVGKKLRGAPGKAAGFVGKVADDPLRFSAFLHEAAAENVISKFSPHLTDADRQALLDLFTSTDPEQVAKLNNIRWRANDAMGDFSRLTPTQVRWARRFLIIPGWLWAGSRYPVHFAATHPGRSAALAYVAAGEPYGDRIGLPQNRPVSDLFADDLPPFVEGIDLPEDFPIFGGKTFRTTSLSPVSTPYEIALALGAQSPETAMSYANPLAKALYNIAARRVDYPGGSYEVGQQEALIRNLERLLPNWTFVKQEIHPDGGGYYPEDESRLGRFFRELGVVPIKVVGETERDEDKWVKEAERLSGGPVPQYVLDLRRASQAYNEQYSAYEKEQGITEGGLTPQERLVVLVRTQVALHPERKAQGAELEARAMTLTDDAAEAAISEGRERIGLTEYGRIQDKLAKARTEARTHTGMVNGGQH
ncbi:MAG: hypothetical protein L0177_16705 [Chloroflexi bacterium]|nr:hypothetical protein [Chloroflexota bacterium]